MVRHTLLASVATFLLAVPAWANPFWSQSADLRFTDPRDGQNKHFHHHMVWLNAGQKYLFDMRSNHFDTFLRLHAPGGAVVAQNDDSGPGLNARIVFQANVSGMYRLTATSWSPNATGRYTVQATKLPSPVGGGVVMAQHGDLKFSDPSFGGKHFRVYNVTLQAGRSYVIEMNSNHFDTFLKLKRPGMGVIAQNDDSGPGRNARLVFTPFVSGTYQVIATSFAPGATGHFHVTVRD